jgi:hypothetical protein
MKKDYRLIALSFAILVFASLMMISASTPRIQDEIYARSLYIVDSSGSIKVMVATDEHGMPSLSFLDRPDNIALTIGVSSIGPHISFSNNGTIKSTFRSDVWSLIGERSTIHALVSESGQAAIIAVDNDSSRLGSFPDDR